MAKRLGGLSDRMKAEKIRLVISTLRATKGRRYAAAKRLGIRPCNLSRLLRTYNLHGQVPKGHSGRPRKGKEAP